MSTKQQMFDYYNERASEYEEFTDGGHPVNPAISEAVAEEVSKLKGIVPGQVSGRCIDIACGTGFWLPVYESSCSEISMIDQSENVLRECNEKIEKLGLQHKTEVIQEDIFTREYEKGVFNTIFCGFLICHLEDEEIDNLIGIFRSILAKGGRFIIADKIWGGARQLTGYDKKRVVTRTLKDGRKYNILNRMFDEEDLRILSERHGFRMEIIFWGEIFFLISGVFDNSQVL